MTEEYPEVPFGGESGAKFWSSKEEGDEIVGTYNGTTRGGKFDNVLARLVDDDGVECLVGVTRSLEDVKRLPIGTRCRIKFLGWGESKTGTKFKKFQIFTVGEVKPEPKTESGSRAGTFAATDEVPFMREEGE